MNAATLCLSFVCVFGQLEFDASPFARYGLPGLVIAWFIWRDYKQSQSHDKRSESQDAKLEQLVQSVNSLVRVTSIEVMSRPQVVARAKAEVQEILTNLPKAE